MTAKVEISHDTLLHMVEEVNKGNKKLDDFAKEMGTSKRTIQRYLTEGGFIAYRGYNVWSKPNETKEEVLAKYRPHALEPLPEKKPKDKPAPTKNVQSKPKKKAPKKPDKTRRLNIELDYSSFVKLKVHSVMINKTMTDIVSELIDQYLKDNIESDI